MNSSALSPSFLVLHSSFFIPTFPTDETFYTLLKKKFTTPPTVVSSTSMTPSKFKYCTLYSELLRVKRICSKQMYVDLYIKFLKREFTAKGYFSLDEKINSYNSKIIKSFDANMRKLPRERADRKPLVYGSTSVFDSVNFFSSKSTEDYFWVARSNWSESPNDRVSEET